MVLDTFMREEKNKDEILLNILQNIKDGLDKAILLLGGGEESERLKSKIQEKQESAPKILEGVFAGDKMVGEDGQIYDISPNYASKSRLVEGDILKLTMTGGGNFIFKQIKPVLRKRLLGELAADEASDEYWVIAENNKWRVLKASISYFKGKSGDRAAILVPQDGVSKWAAVENIIRAEEGL